MPSLPSGGHPRASHSAAQPAPAPPSPPPRSGVGVGVVGPARVQVPKQVPAHTPADMSHSSPRAQRGQLARSSQKPEAHCSPARAGAGGGGGVGGVGVGVGGGGVGGGRSARQPAVPGLSVHHSACEQQWAQARQPALMALQQARGASAAHWHVAAGTTPPVLSRLAEADCVISAPRR